MAQKNQGPGKDQRARRQRGGGQKSCHWPESGDGGQGRQGSRTVQEPEAVSGRCPRAPEGPKGGKRARLPRRDMTELGRTHKMLIEADQPRLPVVVENQNRLNHLCRPRFFRHRRLPESTSFRHNTDTSGWCAAESGPRKLAPDALGAWPRRVRLLCTA